MAQVAKGTTSVRVFSLSVDRTIFAASCWGVTGMAMKPEHSRWMRHSLFTAALVVLLASPAIFGCGPWFDEAVFIPGGAPQTSQPEFAAGKLGILLPTMRRSYLIVAYRYLNGIKLTA